VQRLNSNASIVKKLAVPLAWLLGVIAVMLSGLQSNPYLEYVRNIPPPHPYPTSMVVWIIVLLSLHAALLIFALRPASYSRSWGRALFALAISIVFLAFGLVGSMHAPPAWIAYLFWLLVVAIATLVLTLWSLVAATRNRADAK
jgi:hypothetical protein